MKNKSGAYGAVMQELKDNQHKIVNFKYHLISTLFFAGLGSLLSLIAYGAIVMVFLGILEISPSFALLIFLCVICLLVGAVLTAHVATRRLPETYKERYLPAWMPFLTALISFAICFLLAKGSPIEMMRGLITPFLILNPTYAPLAIFIPLLGTIWIVILPPLFFNLVFLIAFAIFERREESHPVYTNWKFTGIIASVAVMFSVIFGGTLAYRYSTVNVLPPSYEYAYGNGYSSVELWQYEIDNVNNILPKLSEPSTFRIENEKDFPVLDGAEAAFPVYSAFANACFEFPPAKNNISGEKVPFTNTIYALERLINGEIDIFFGAQPSQAQLKMAEVAGVELVMTPIASEAFVFFVYHTNKVDSLTEEQIKRIYSGEVKNWYEVGGYDNPLRAYQRPENSGSQTMLQYIMGDTEITKPLIEEIIGGMGELTERVASYRDSVTSIGFTFKFFLTSMTANADKVKILAINGIEPTDETIASGLYPYTTNLYAISVKSNKKSTVQPFIEWMLGEQGQYIIEQIGYVPMG